MKFEKQASEDVWALVNKADILICKTMNKLKYETVLLYFNIGKLIVNYKRDNNTKYGDDVISKFCSELGLRYGKGFSQRNIYNAIKFYEFFANLQTSANSFRNEKSVLNIFENITWSHIIEILVLDDVRVMYFYINEINDKKLTIKEIRREIKSKAYERTVINQRTCGIKNEIERTLKDPLVLNIVDKKRTERELEREIIENISHFKKEIGNNIMFYE